jgi:hypothetical protein
MEKEELRAAKFGYVKNVAGLRAGKTERGDLDLGDGDFRRILGLRNSRLSGPRAATASDAGGRTRAVFLP